MGMPEEMVSDPDRVKSQLFAHPRAVDEPGRRGLLAEVGEQNSKLNSCHIKHSPRVPGSPEGHRPSLGDARDKFSMTTLPNDLAVFGHDRSSNHRQHRHSPDLPPGVGTPLDLGVKPFVAEDSLALEIDDDEIGL